MRPIRVDRKIHQFYSHFCRFFIPSSWRALCVLSFVQDYCFTAFAAAALYFFFSSSFFTIQNSLSSSNNQLMIEDGKWVWAHKKTKKLIHTRTSTSFMNKIQNSETSFPFSLYLSHLLYSRCIYGDFSIWNSVFFQLITSNFNAIFFFRWFQRTKTKLEQNHQ